MKFKNYIILLVAFSLLSVGCKKEKVNSIKESIEKDTLQIVDTLVKIRRDIHEYPELAGNEKRTSKIVATYLTDLGLEVQTGVAGYGVIGILKGDQEGKNIAWRAEMDALPHDFPDQVPFKSKIPGVQHGCGHDIHIAIALGIAEVLAKNKDRVQGTIYFIFQPEEETFVGAKNMVASKQFSNLNLDEIYGLHITNLPVGQLLIKPDELFAYQKQIALTFDTKISNEEIDTLYNEIRIGMQRNREGATPWEISKAFDAEVGISNPNTYFDDYFYLEDNFYMKESDNQLQLTATLYETNKLNIPNILPKIEQIINGSDYKDNFIASSYIQANPTVLNDKILADKAMKTINAIYGDNTVLMDYGQIPYFNDDFCYYQQEVPGVYFLLGGSNIAKGFVAMNHAPNFKVDEACIPIGVTTFASLLLERAHNE